MKTSHWKIRLSAFILFFLFLVESIEAQTGRRRPNIVVMITDDQDVMLGSMDAMENTRNRIVRGGTSFNNAFTTSPICCPSRSSFFTGLYSHNHNVLTNHINCSSSQWRRDHENRTFATYLERSGYATGYFGKYLNEYDGEHIPPGWQYWMGLIKNSQYYNYTLLHNGRKEEHSDDYAKDYLTDLIVNRSIEYFRRKKQEEADKPILSVLSFPAPHGTEDGAPQYHHLYQNVTSHINPSFDYGPNDDKHWILSRNKLPMDATQHRFSTVLQQKRLQTLRSVDDGVEKFVRMLDDIGELDNTYILYTSDHGFHIGQFRLAKGKSMPYDFDIRIPFFLRGPGVQPNSSINKIVLNIDIAPTILGMAGLDAPEWMDGRNFMPLVNRQSNLSPPWRDTFLVERGKIPLTKIHMEKPKLPSRQEKVHKVCERSQFKLPCLPRQEWTCVSEDGILKIRKCKKLNRNLNGGGARSKKRCSCRKKDSNRRISSKCRRRIETAMQIAGGQVQISGNLNPILRRRFLSRKRRRGARRHQRRRGADVGFDIPAGNSSDLPLGGNRNDVSLTCTLSITNGPNIQCMQDSQAVGPIEYKSYIQQLQNNIRILKLYADCRVKRERKCKCGTRRESRKRVSRTASEHPMRLIAKEIKEAHARRMDAFKRRRKESHQTKRKPRRPKTPRRKSSKKLNCAQAKMSCFRLSRDRWVTKPIWDGEEKCFCTNSKNNTYWCVRTINETANLLYCEFITGFVEYYDLNTDPFQLSNTYHDLQPHVHASLNAELAQLRVCKGSRHCHVLRSNQSQDVEPPTQPYLVEVTNPPVDESTSGSPTTTALPMAANTTLPYQETFPVARNGTSSQRRKGGRYDRLLTCPKSLSRKSLRKCKKRRNMMKARRQLSRRY